MKHLIILLCLAFSLLLTGCPSQKDTPSPQPTEPSKQTQEVQKNADISTAVSVSPADIPAYTGEAFTVCNGNTPSFTAEEIQRARKGAFEFYSPLDELGRCGYTVACIGKEIMPTEPRGKIGMIKPSGWKMAKYDIVDGKYLYNRCHLIGFQLAGENANPKNLITGTRYLNVIGMLPFENQVADYVKRTGNHVLYAVTPLYNGKELVARGVRMEAYSLEDNGKLAFHVFCHNVQPGVEINYRNGESRLKGNISDSDRKAIEKSIKRHDKKVQKKKQY